jgi:phosphatidylserine/phosphatidylglycerophosphate/cardiolipin synthase-like enzyme
VRRLTLSLLVGLASASTAMTGAAGWAPLASGGHIARPALVSGCELDPLGATEVCVSSPPAHNGRDTTIVGRLSQLFNAAGPGDSIRIAIFRWDLRPQADALLAAQARGARVEVVADHDVVTNRVGARLLRRLEAHNPRDNAVIVCPGACLPFSGNGPAPPRSNVNHHKLFLFDIAGERSVATTSSNVVRVQLHQFNTMLRVIDEPLYDFHLAYFKRLRAQRWTVAAQTWDDSDKRSTGEPKGFVFPTRHDPMIALLRRVDCAEGMRQVDVVVAVITRNDVRRELGRLQADGCRVRVVVQQRHLEKWVQAPAELAGGGTVNLRDDQVRTALIHDKVIAIHALVGGREQRLVVTGAANFTCGALLYNDEGMILVADDWVFARVGEHLDDLWRHAHQTQGVDESASPVCR